MTAPFDGKPFDNNAKTVTVSREWYEHALHVLRIEGLSRCPFCNSDRPYVSDGGDETFNPRRGCTVCNRWWESKELRF